MADSATLGRCLRPWVFVVTLVLLASQAGAVLALDVHQLQCGGNTPNQPTGCGIPPAPRAPECQGVTVPAGKNLLHYIANGLSAAEKVGATLDLEGIPGFTGIQPDNSRSATLHFTVLVPQSFVPSKTNVELHLPNATSYKGNFNLSHACFGPPDANPGPGPGPGPGGDNPVPELDSIALFGLGGIALAGYAWRQRRRRKTT
jgi:hypothetical protein